MLLKTIAAASLAAVCAAAAAAQPEVAPDFSRKMYQ